MKITVTLRYLNRKVVNICTTEEVCEGTTAGALSYAVLTAHEKEENICFTGANIAILCNGRIVPPEYVLKEGDELKLIPVAAGG